MKSLLAWIKTFFALMLLYTNIIDTQATTCYSSESCLIDDLFSSYNSVVRPAAHPETPVNVVTRLYIRALGGIDEKNEIMSLVGSLLLTWNDAYLTWNPSDYNNTINLVLFANQIWLPDVAIYNSIGDYYKSTYKDDFRVNVLYDGTIAWDFGGTFETTCSLDISEYPFDTQKCSILMRNWAYSEEMVDLQFMDDEPYDKSDYEESSLWHLESIKTKRTRNELLIDGIYQPQLEYKLIFKRKTLYYIYNIIAPTFLIAAITLSLFWLPPGCGEKLGLGVTVLLAFSVFQIIIMDNTPVNSDVTPRISKVMLFVMVMAAISIIVSVITVTIDLMSSATRLPKWARIVFFKVLARAFFLTSEIPDLPETDQSTNENAVADISIISDPEKVPKKVKTELGELLEEMKYLTNYVKSQEHDEKIKDEWKLCSKLVDRLMFWTSLVIFVLYFIYTVAAISAES